MTEIKLYKIAFLLLLFLPKIPIIYLSGYSQGIRIDDFLILLLSINILISNYKTKILEYRIKPAPFIFVVVYLLFSMIVGSYMGIEQEWIIFIRLIEYFFVIYFLNAPCLDKVFIKKSLIAFILINTVIAIPQHYLLLGGFASFGYLPAGHAWLERPYGLLGGPWELGASVAISFFVLKIIGCKSWQLFFLNICVIICLILYDTRANTLAYFIGLIYVYKDYVLRPKTFILLTGLGLAFYFSFWTKRYESLIELTSILWGVINGENLIIDFLNFETSIKNRLSVWVENYNLWSDNIFLILFGIGWHSLYMESFLLRLLFSFGIIGSALFIILFKDAKIGIIIFILISGVTLDLFLAFKIFLLIAIYSRIQFESNKRNLEIKNLSI